MKRKTMKVYAVRDDEGDFMELVKAQNKTQAWRKVAKEHGVTLQKAKDFLDLEKETIY